MLCYVMLCYVMLCYVMFCYVILLHMKHLNRSVVSYCRAKNEDCHLIKSRPCHDFVYRNCFTGCELVDWLIQNGEVSDRSQGVLLGRDLLDQAIIKHGKSV